MSHYTNLWHHAKHETNKKKQTTGNTPETGPGVVATRPWPERSRASCGCNPTHCSSVAGSGTPWFGQTQASHALGGTSVLLIGQASNPIRSSPTAWGTGVWLCRRLLDASAHRARDLEVVRDTLSSRFRLARFAAHGLELPKAATGSLPARRRSHCPLAALHLAKDKKSGTSWALRSYLKMKAASRWCAHSSTPGPRAGKHPASGRPFNTTNALTFWVHCSSRPKAAKSNCAPKCTSIRSPGRKSLPSCVTCCESSVAPSCWCGTRLRFINARKCKRFWRNIRVFTFILFPPTRQNSIPSSLCGHKPMNIWQARPQKT